jgi:hypothetical protein
LASKRRQSSSPFSSYDLASLAAKTGQSYQYTNIKFVIRQKLEKAYKITQIEMYDSPVIGAPDIFRHH